MTPDGQLLSSDSFQLLTSDGSSLLQGEDVHALLSPPVLLGNSSPTVQQQAVDQLLLGSVPIAPHSADHRVLGSVPVAPQPADHVILEAPSSAPSPTDNVLLSSTPTLARSADSNLSPPTRGAIMSVNQFSSSSAVVPCPAAHPTAGNPLLESSQLSNGGTLPEDDGTRGRHDRHQDTSGQYFVTKSGSASSTTTGVKRPPKKTAYREKIKSITTGLATPFTEPPVSSGAVFAGQQVLVTRNLISGQSPPATSSAAAKMSLPAIVFPREPLLPSEIQGFVSGLGYAAGGLPAFSSPPAVSSSTLSAAKSVRPPAKGKSRSKAKENSKVLYP